MKGIILASLIENITTRKDKTLKIVLGTQELSNGNAGELFGYMNSLCAVYISPKENIDQKEISQLDALDPELNNKSQSKRIRDVLFILFKQDSEGHNDFHAYYRLKTDMYIDHLKSKINP